MAMFIVFSGALWFLEGIGFSLDESAYFFQGAYRTEVWARFPAQRLSPLESWNPYPKEVAGPTAAQEASHRSKHRLFCFGRRFGCCGAADGAPATAQSRPQTTNPPPSIYKAAALWIFWGTLRNHAEPCGTRSGPDCSVPSWHL